MHIAFQTMWHLQAYIDTYSTYPHLDERKLRVCLRLHESVEAAAVNGTTGPAPYLLTLPPGYAPSPNNAVGGEGKREETNHRGEGQKDSEKEQQQQNGARSRGGSLDQQGSGEYNLDPAILSQYLSKRRRSEYFDNVTQLIDTLVKISDKVMQVPPHQRRMFFLYLHHLFFSPHLTMKYLEERLRGEVKKIDDSIPDSGLYIPIDEIRRLHTCIVRIPPTEAFLLDSNSRTHVSVLPY